MEREREREGGGGGGRWKDMAEVNARGLGEGEAYGGSNRQMDNKHHDTDSHNSYTKQDGKTNGWTTMLAYIYIFLMGFYKTVT